MKLVVCFILFIFSFSLLANSKIIETSIKNKLSNSSKLDDKKTFGHNMSPNTYTLSQGGYSFGPYAIAVGLTDNITIATSPWMYYGYNSHNYMIRTSYKLNSNFQLGGQMMYLKTYRTNINQVHNKDYAVKEEGYQMEVIKTYLTLSHKVSSVLTNHYSLTYDHYYDETFPYSIRREPLNDDPYQFNLTNLMEFTLTDNIINQFEFGILGLNYFYPQIIIGTSIGYKFSSSYLQFGISTTGTPISYFSPKKIDIHQDYDISRDNVKYDFSLHPEMQWQFFF